MPIMCRIFVFLICTLLSSYALSAYKIEIDPAWGGELHSGLSTEIRIGVYSPYAGEFQFRLTNDEMQITTNIEVESNKLKQKWLPVIPSKNTPLKIVAYRMGKEVYKTELHTNSLPKPKYVVATLLRDQNAINPNSRKLINVDTTVSFLYLNIEHLPHYFQSYSNIDALLINQQQIESLNSHQREALMTYTENCGQLYLFKAGAEFLNMFKRTAGCKAVYIYGTQSADETIESLLNNRQHYVPEILSKNETLLINKNGYSTNAIYLLSAVFIAYFFIMLLLAIYADRVILSVFFCLTMSGIIIYVLEKQASSISLTTWSEVENNKKSVRYTALTTVNGSLINNTRLVLPVKFGIPVRLNVNNLDKIYAFDNSPYYNVVNTSINMLSPNQYMTYGLYEANPPLSLEISETSLIITNLSSKASVPAVLNWNDKHYSIPTLQPDERWTPNGNLDPWQPSDIERLFRQKTKNDIAAILIRNDSNYFDLEEDTLSTKNWLLIRMTSNSTHL